MTSGRCLKYIRSDIIFSFPSLLGEILSGALAVTGFTWATSPICTELEVVVMDWLAKMLQLPTEYLTANGGGGVIQG